MHAAESTAAQILGVSIAEAVMDCLVVEEDRGLLPRTLKELRRHLLDLVDHCSAQQITSVEELAPALVSDYVAERCRERGPATTKAVIWAMRKLGGYLMLRGAVAVDPARALKSPVVPRRARLPEYLSVDQLRQLLATAAEKRPGRDVVILSLLAGTGLRPHELTSLRRADVQVAQQRLDVRVKGGWWKPTALSPSMAKLLGDYLAAIDAEHPVGRIEAVFVSSRSRAISVSWLQRMVRRAGEDAGLPFRLTCTHLRHTFATYAADRHGRAVTKALMGHRSLRTTDVYTHLSPRRFKALMGRHPYPTRTRPHAS